MPSLAKILEPIRAAHAGGSRIVLLLDYDGTLVPIVDQPARAVLPATTRALLGRLARRPGFFAGILSGRGLLELETLVGLSRLFYAGTTGQELNLHGKRFAAAVGESGRLRLHHLAQSLGALAWEFPGAWVENKGLGLTLHYRKVPPPDFPALEEKVLKALDQTGGQVRFVQGPMAFEFIPANDWTKGAAVQRIVAHVGQPALPIYAGDGANDRDALLAARDLGGLAVGVGPSAPACAQYHLDNPAHLLSFLARLDEVLRPTAAK